MILMMILIPAAITFLLRLLPFIFFNNREMSPKVKELGERLPYAIMAALIVYCLKGINLAALTDSAALIAACAVTALTHLFKKNTVISIIAGTVCYMILLRIL